MSRIPLLGGAYTARSIIANAQRCVNLYPENNQQDAPTPVTHYPTPGLTLLATGFYDPDVVGAIGQGTIESGGTGYVSGTFANTALTGGTGTGARATLLVKNGRVISVTITTAGTGYSFGDLLSFAGAGTNFSWKVGTVSISGNTVSRCMYRASNGDLYRVIGNRVFYVSADWDHTLLGQLTGNSTTPCSMVDNGLAVVVVDGTSAGYCINMETREFGLISSPDFYGGDKADFSDTFFMFNRPGTKQWYISLSNVTFTMLTNGTAFDALDIASKASYPDPISTLAVVHREVWLIGELTTEIWYNAGAADFEFEELPGTKVEHGCVAKYSLAKNDNALYWLSQDLQGQAIVVKGAMYEVQRISTHAIEQEIAKYPNISDAIGYIYQQEGHIFYVLTFVQAKKTWVLDLNTELWHERASRDFAQNLSRHWGNCAANAYNKIVVGDFQNGNLYYFNLNAYRDNTTPVTRVRSFPHTIKEDNRISYLNFTADMAVGEDDGSIDLSDQTDPPLVFLSWSDDRGKTFGNKVPQSLGAIGQYLTSIQWNRLGYGRDRVFELVWSIPAKTALQGAWINVSESEE